MIVPWRSGYSLGMGYRTDTNSTTCVAVTFERDAVRGGDDTGVAADVETKSFLIDSSKQYCDLLDQSSNVGLHYGMANIGLSLNLAQNMTIKKNTLHAVVLAKHKDSEPKLLQGAKLTPLAQRKLREEGPVVFHSMFGDRYIGGMSRGGRFAGIYSMTFNSTQNYRSAKLGVEAALQDLDLGKASFSGSMQKYEGQYTSKSWAAAYGWPKPELPVNQSPDELWAAAKRMDATKGTPISALLCRFSQLADYMEAKEEFARSCGPEKALAAQQGLPGLESRDLEEDDSIMMARQELGKESIKLQYLEKLLEAEETNISDAFLPDLNALSDKVMSARLMLAAFKDRANLCALAVRLQYYQREDTPEPLTKQWDTGNMLKQQLKADQLEGQVNRLLQGLSSREMESKWFGALSDGNPTRVELDGRELCFVFLKPSAANKSRSFICGRYSISHLDGAAEYPIFKMSKFARIAMRTDTSIYMPLFLPNLFSRDFRDSLHAFWSCIRKKQVTGIRGVARVEVLQGKFVGGPRRALLQIRFLRSDGSLIKQVPDCPNRALFEASQREWTSIPEAGQPGRVVAITGQGNALKFHWVPV